jgi:putative serine protease PepD
MMQSTHHNMETTEAARKTLAAPPRRTKVTACVAALCLASGGLGAGLTAALSGGTPPAVTSRPAYRPTPPAMTRLSASIDTPQVVANVEPAVVNVNTNLDALEGGGQAAGTGMIVSPNGEIVTAPTSRRSSVPTRRLTSQSSG